MAPEVRTVVRVTSHRAREKLRCLIGPTQGYYSWTRDGSWREYPPERVEEALAIKGVKRSMWREDLRPYVDWE